jgi:hypothetical protein
MLVYGIIDYMKHIKNPPLKVLLMIINIMAIVFFGYSAQESYSKADPPEETPPDTTKQDVGFEDSLQADIDVASGYMQGIYNELPDVSKLKEQIPSLDQIKQNIPTLESIKEKIPDVRNVVANVQPTTDIAQQINAALKDGKKLVISLETDKPNAASVAPAP